jgi:hypothetical protein
MTAKTSYLSNVGIISLVCMLILSCGSSKKAAVPCPDFSHNRSYRSEITRNRDGNNRIAGLQRASKNHYQKNSAVIPLSDERDAAGSDNEIAGLFTDTASQDQERLNYMNGLLASVGSGSAALVFPAAAKPARVLYDTNMQVPCDTIIFKQGNRIIGIVQAIGLNDIKYRACGSTEGPLISVLKTEIFVIKHPDGTRDYFYSENPVTEAQTAGPPAKRIEPFAGWGFAMSILGLFLFGIPLGITSIVFGFVGLHRIGKYPKRYNGKGFAIVSILLGFIDVIGMLILLSSM